MDKIIHELTIEDLQKLQTAMDKCILILKFGADWCGPCKKIAPAFYKFVQEAPPNIIFADIDVDEQLELYMALKRNKMVNGIPVMIAYYGNAKRDKWFIPEDSVIGADETSVNAFFTRTKSKAIEMQHPAAGYSYYS